MLGLDPDPAALWPQAQRAGCSSGRRGAGASARRRRCCAHCRALIDATAPACVAVKLQLARFELLGAPGWAALASGRRARARARPARDRRRQARRHRRQRARLRGGAVRRRATRRSGRLDGLRRGPRDGQPADGRRRARAVRGGRARERARACSCSCARPTRAPPTSRICALRRRRRGVGAARRDRRASSARPASGEAGLSDVGAVVGATAPAHLARARELMPRAPSSCCPASARRAGASRISRRRSRPGRAGGLVTASRSIAGAHLARRGGSTRRSAARAEAERLREAAWALSDAQPSVSATVRPLACDAFGGTAAAGGPKVGEEPG